MAEEATDQSNRESLAGRARHLRAKAKPLAQTTIRK
jgi:hypothetical protein